MQDPFADIPMVGQRGPINTGTPVSQQTSEVDRARIGNDAARVDIAKRQLALDESNFNQRQEDDEKEREEALRLQAQADQTARGKLLRFIGRASQVALDADDNDGWFETGTTGAIMRSFPGSNAAKDLVADTKSLRANLAFDALQAMRDASKTGGALGQVSEIELQLLESAVANVNPEGQTHENFLKNLEYVRQAYLDKLSLVDPKMAKSLGYDAQEAEKGWTDIIGQYGRQFGVGNFEQLKASRGQTQSGVPSDIQAIMKKYGQ